MFNPNTDDIIDVALLVLAAGAINQPLKEMYYIKIQEIKPSSLLRLN